MLVYATHFELECTLKQVLPVIARWIGEKGGQNYQQEWLINTPEQSRRLANGSRLETIYVNSGYPKMLSVTFSHGDQAVSGRQWVTELGFRENEEDILEVSCILETREISTRVTAPVNQTRPVVIHHLLRACPSGKNVIGAEVEPLRTLDDARSLAYEIDSFDERRYPIIIVSTDANGDALVDLKKLTYFVESLARVRIIPAGANQEEYRQALGPYFARNGEIVIVYPRFRSRTRGEAEPRIPINRIRPEEIASLVASDDPTAGEKTAKHIFSLLTHHTNLPMSWGHISPHIIKEEQSARMIRRAREVLSQKVASESETSEKIALYDTYITALEQQNQTLIEELHQVREENNATKEQLEVVGNESAQLKEAYDHTLTQMGGRELDVRGRLPDTLRDAMVHAAFQQATPEECLLAISALYPDRVVVLDSAFSSAKRSSGFNNKSRVFELLKLLADDYWTRLIEGKGDTEARSVFGNAYSAKETNMLAKRGRDLRTFIYRDAPIMMEQHLRIGAKESSAETLRIHFAWDSERKVLVIGYCGPHLDFK